MDVLSEIYLVFEKPMLFHFAINDSLKTVLGINLLHLSHLVFGCILKTNQLDSSKGTSYRAKKRKEQIKDKIEKVYLATFLI